jgi:integral membrane protein (TIGR03766 family)
MKKRIKLLAILLLMLTLVYQVLLVASVYAFPGWDPGEILMAIQNNGFPAGFYDGDYLSYYPNNRFFYFLMHFISSITGGAHLRVWQMFNALCIDLGVILTALAARNKFGKKCGYLSYFLGILLVALTPRLYLPYTDTVVLPLVAAGLYLLTLYKSTDKLTKLIWSGGLLGIIVALTYSMKMSASIPFIAILIIGIFRFFSNKEKGLTLARKSLLVYVSLAFAGLALTNIAFETYSANQTIMPIHKEKAIPVTHFMMMGLTGDGGWNHEDVLTTLNAKDRSQRIAVHTSVILQRLDEYGAKGYAAFLLEKFRSNTADGTFGWGVEADCLAAPEELGGFLSLPAKVIKSLYSLDGSSLSLFRFYAQIIWILTLIAMLLTSKTRDDFSTALKLSFIGALVFLLLFEGGRSRYLIQFLPTISILASLGTMRFYEMLRGISKK